MTSSGRKPTRASNQSMRVASVSDHCDASNTGGLRILCCEQLPHQLAGLVVVAGEHQRVRHRSLQHQLQGEFVAHDFTGVSIVRILQRCSQRLCGVGVRVRRQRTGRRPRVLAARRVPPSRNRSVLAALRHDSSPTTRQVRWCLLGSDSTFNTFMCRAVRPARSRFWPRIARRT